jgi:extracellular matrix regulatory protein B
MMYLHLGQDTVVSFDEIIGIFDLDTSTVSKTTRDYLSRAELAGEVVNVSMELPKSFTVCKGAGGKTTVYISQISSSTLLKRTGYIQGLSNI